MRKQKLLKNRSLLETPDWTALQKIGIITSIQSSKISLTGNKIPKLNLEIWNLQNTNVPKLSSVENLYAKVLFQLNNMYIIVKPQT